MSHSWSWSHSLLSHVDATTPWCDKEGQERPSLNKVGCILKACPCQRWAWLAHDWQLGPAARPYPTATGSHGMALQNTLRVSESDLRGHSSAHCFCPGPCWHCSLQEPGRPWF